jgi:hypothetical protein
MQRVSGWASGWLRATGQGISRGVLPLVAAAGLLAGAAMAAGDPAAGVPGASAEASGAQQRSPDNLRKADFRDEAPSAQAREVADWVVRSADNNRLPFIVIDKVQARVYVFQADGQLRGATSALMGLARGDHTVPGIGQRKLSSIRPEERTTPAGRFMASLDRDIHGVEVLWVDYDSSVSLHKIVPGTPKERRAQRMASPNPADKRITFGCINVPVRFYDSIVSPSFKGTYGVVYVLPETRPASEVFGFRTALQADRDAMQDTAALK